MPETIIKVKGWSCPDCGYNQDFEPTTVSMKWHMVDSVPPNQRDDGWSSLAKHDWNDLVCPSCLIEQGKEEKRYRVAEMNEVMRGNEAKPDKFDRKPLKALKVHQDITLTVMGEEEIENEIDPEHSRAVKHEMKVGTTAEKNDYRVKRRKDIAEAIVAANKRK